jgi:hypothetical protein
MPAELDHQRKALAGERNSRLRGYVAGAAQDLPQMHRPGLVQVHPWWLVQLQHRGLHFPVGPGRRATDARRGPPSSAQPRVPIDRLVRGGRKMARMCSVPPKGDYPSRFAIVACGSVHEMPECSSCSVPRFAHLQQGVRR